MELVDINGVMEIFVIGKWKNGVREGEGLYEFK